MKETRKLVRVMVADNFPELSGKKISLWSLNMGHYWGNSLWLLPGWRLIIISSKSRAVSNECLRGLLAHELSHQVIYSRDSWLRYLVRVPSLYLFHKDQIRAEECAVDSLVMDRGFGRHLYLLTQIIDSDPAHDQVQKYYFTPAEIKDYCVKNNLPC